MRYSLLALLVTTPIIATPPGKTDVRDALYYFHRAHSMDPAVARPDLTKQSKVFAAVNGPPGTNEIELVAGLANELRERASSASVRVRCSHPDPQYFGDRPCLSERSARQMRRITIEDL